jgi:heterodisulfide reductase subunit A2
MKTIKLKINGIETEAEDRTPILGIATRLGIDIPTLCHHPIIEPYAVCRICTVEVRHGKRVRMVTACNYPASNGIEVFTDSERVRRERKLIIELMMSRCGHLPILEKLAKEYGITEPQFGLGDDDCILCGLCVRVCNEVVGANVLGFFNRGATREVSTAYGQTSDTCIACGACAYVCPTGAITMDNDASELRRLLPLGPVTPIHIPFQQAVPHKPVIDKDSCIHFKTGACEACAAVCEAKAIDHTQQDEIVEIEVGSIIAATGFKPFDASRLEQFGYRRFPNVVTALEFERMNNASGPTGGRITMEDGKTPESVAVIHCVGSRDRNTNEHCSRVCCMMALKYAHLIHEKTGAAVYDFYIDMRCFGKGYEEFYNRLLEEGVFFIRGRAAEVSDFAVYDSEVGKLVVRCEDTLIGAVRRIPVDMVVLMTGMEPNEGVERIARQLTISRSKDGFFLEQHPKLAPVATPTDGVFIAGTCQGPKDIPDTVAQASAAAAAALALSVRGVVNIDPVSAQVIPDKCAGCRLCNTLCPFSAITFDATEEVSAINDALCKGCGTCAAACPSGAIKARHFTDRQLLEEIVGVSA